MKRCVLITSVLFFACAMFAQDTVFVQTLTYDSITTRRATFQFPTDDPNNYRKILMVYSLKCDPATTADGFDCGEWDYLTYNNIYHHTGELDTAGNEIVEVFEIGRFITPYGINLNLDTHGHNPGNNGFTWVYDVTDYAHLLNGLVDMRAGNNQELIDVQFWFIKGTPAREVKNIDRIWGSRRSYRYRDLDSDAVLSDKAIPVHKDAGTFKVITRLTGHGHHSNDGSFPHCCEWKDNAHYFYVNGMQVDSWHIWQTHQCANNPVYPQGGTWPGAREGWCPGDRVHDHEIEITDYVNGDSVRLDYGITPIPQNNTGMGNGNYQVAMQLIQYGDYNFDNDIELYDVIRPSKKDEYARLNPVCNSGEILVRNGGKNVLSSFDITYQVSGGISQTIQWTGQLQPSEKTTVELPFPNEAFITSDGSHTFTCTVDNPNGQHDQNPENNTMSVPYVEPFVVNGTNGLLFELNTNNRPNETRYTLSDMAGNVLINRSSGLAANTLYQDEVTLESGKCYTVEVLDSANDGLSYWADPNAGNGSFRIRRKIGNINGPTLQSFESEFGRDVLFTFSMGVITDIDEPSIKPLAVSVFPSPAKDNVYVGVQSLDSEAVLTVFDVLGHRMYSEALAAGEQINTTIPTTDWKQGTYTIQIVSKDGFSTKKVVKQ